MTAGSPGPEPPAGEPAEPPAGSPAKRPAGSPAERAVDVVVSFLGCASSRDWELAVSLLEPGVTREGPDGAVVAGRQAYLGYLQEVLAPGATYAAQLLHVAATPDGSHVLAELDEELVPPDRPAMRAREVMVFAVTPDGRIAGLSVYAKQP